MPSTFGIQKGMDNWLDEKEIKGLPSRGIQYRPITPATSMLMLYRANGNEKYRKMADLFRSQLKTASAYKRGRLLAQEDLSIPDVARRAVYGPALLRGVFKHLPRGQLERHRESVRLDGKRSRDAKTGLLYHGWDESKQQKWADKTSGRSPHFWGRAMGWYAMGLIDTLEYFPKDHPRRGELSRS
ncbi:MAG: glycoside hydrolase family 88 protein [Acidobacteria bacterium]|nr:glycoside hydrolase family 88 protein [Acidobacteriota bacterium]